MRFASASRFPWASALGKRHRTPIGLSLLPDGIHAVQLERLGGRQVRAFASAEVCDGPARLEEDARAFGRWLDERVFAGRAFQGRRIVTALAPPDVKLMVLSYPDDGSSEEAARILDLAVQRGGAAAEELVVDYVPIRMLETSGRERSALVAVAPRDGVIEHLERLRSAGLEVAALEIAPVALHRVLKRDASHGPDVNAVSLYTRAAGGELLVLWGRRLVLYRELQFGTDRMLEDVGKALEIEPAEASAMLERYGVVPPGPGDPAEEDVAAAHEIADTLREILKPAFYSLAEQIEKSVVYTASRSRGASPDRVHLLGSLVRWPRADRLLRSLVSLPVHSIEPRASYAWSPERDGVGPESSGSLLALGHALRGGEDG